MAEQVVRYVALVLKEPGTEYWVTAPDLGVCFSTGATIAEAKAAFPQALELHITGMREEGQHLPSPRTRREVLAAISHRIVEDYLIEVELDPVPRQVHPAHPTNRTRLS